VRACGRPRPAPGRGSRSTDWRSGACGGRARWRLRDAGGEGGQERAGSASTDGRPPPPGPRDEPFGQRRHALLPGASATERRSPDLLAGQGANEEVCVRSRHPSGPDRPRRDMRAAGPSGVERRRGRQAASPCVGARASVDGAALAGCGEDGQGGGLWAATGFEVLPLWVTPCARGRDIGNEPVLRSACGRDGQVGFARALARCQGRGRHTGRWASLPVREQGWDGWRLAGSRCARAGARVDGAALAACGEDGEGGGLWAASHFARGQDIGDGRALRSACGRDGQVGFACALARCDGRGPHTVRCASLPAGRTARAGALWAASHFARGRDIDDGQALRSVCGRDGQVGFACALARCQGRGPHTGRCASLPVREQGREGCRLAGSQCAGARASVDGAVRAACGEDSQGGGPWAATGFEVLPLSVTPCAQGRDVGDGWALRSACGRDGPVGFARSLALCQGRGRHTGRWASLPVREQGREGCRLAASPCVGAGARVERAALHCLRVDGQGGFRRAASPCAGAGVRADGAALAACGEDGQGGGLWAATGFEVLPLWVTPCARGWDIGDGRALRSACGRVARSGLRALSTDARAAVAAQGVVHRCPRRSRAGKGSGGRPRHASGPGPAPMERCSLPAGRTARVGASGRPRREVGIAARAGAGPRIVPAGSLARCQGRGRRTGRCASLPAPEQGREGFRRAASPCVGAGVRVDGAVLAACGEHGQGGGLWAATGFEVLPLRVTPCARGRDIGDGRALPSACGRDGPVGFARTLARCQGRGRHIGRWASLPVREPGREGCRMAGSQCAGARASVDGAVGAACGEDGQGGGLWAATAFEVLPLSVTPCARGRDIGDGRALPPAWGRDGPVGFARRLARCQGRGRHIGRWASLPVREQGREGYRLAGSPCVGAGVRVDGAALAACGGRARVGDSRRFLISGGDGGQ
jgi:hypothetical protein